jgi:cell division septum initiation protein DivIVA
MTQGYSLELESVKAFVARAGLEPYGFHDAVIRSFDVDRDGSVHVRELLPAVARGLERFINSQLLEENRVLRQQVENLTHKLARAASKLTSSSNPSAYESEGRENLVDGGRGPGSASAVFRPRRRLRQALALRHAAVEQSSHALAPPIAGSSDRLLGASIAPSIAPALAASASIGQRQRLSRLAASRALLAARNASDASAEQALASRPGPARLPHDQDRNVLQDWQVPEGRGDMVGLVGWGERRRKNETERAKLLYFVPPGATAGVPDTILVCAVLAVLVYVCVPACTCVYVYVRLRTCVREYSCVRAYMCTCVRVHLSV